MARIIVAKNRDALKKLIIPDGTNIMLTETGEEFVYPNWPTRTPPIEGQLYEAVPELEQITEYNWATARRFTGDIEEASLITSIVDNGDEHEVANGARHKVLIDIDHPISVVPSSTPGHGHLYIDKELTWEQYSKLLDVLAEVGLVESGYVGASLERGYTSLRLPWVKKDQEPEPTCAYCHRTATEEYAVDAEAEGITPAMFARTQDSTYNRRTNHFTCDACYIKIGMPLFKDGWETP